MIRATVSSMAVLMLCAAPVLADDDRGRGDDHGKPEDKGAAPPMGNAGGEDRGPARTAEAENTKHQARLAKLQKLEDIAKAQNKAELLTRVAAMRERELKRHEHALARIARGGDRRDDRKDVRDDRKDVRDDRRDGREERREERQEAREDKKDDVKERAEAIKAAKKAKKKDK